MGWRKGRKVMGSSRRGGGVGVEVVISTCLQGKETKSTERSKAQLLLLLCPSAQLKHLGWGRAVQFKYRKCSSGLYNGLNVHHR